MLANIPRLQELLKREQLNAIIATCPENVTYSSGFWAMSQWVRRGPQAYVLLPREGQSCIIANSGILDLIPDHDSNPVAMFNPFMARVKTKASETVENGLSVVEADGK